MIKEEIVDNSPQLIKPKPREIRRDDDRADLTRSTVENFFGVKVTATFYDGTGSTPDHDIVDLEIPHNLRKIPDDIMVGLKSRTASIRRGQGHWTTTHIYLRSNSSCTATLYLVK